MMRVWDLPTRIFHWALVALVASALVTGFILPQWWMDLHMAAGLGIVGLLVFRLAWAFYGPEYSRLVSFTPNPRTLWSYLRGLFFLRPPHHIGHNPLGALMVLGLFAVLTALTATGLIELGGEEKLGPLSKVLSYAAGTAAKPVHSVLAWVAIGMAVLHITGVTTTSRLFGEGLVRAMLHGYKRIPPGVPFPTPRPAHPVKAAVGLTVTVAVAALAFWWLARMPDQGWRAVTLLPTYRKACGACHTAHHPSLLPAATWQNLLSGLDAHFGEDASLPPLTQAEIAAFLGANASETFDTEAAVRFRPRSPAEPLRITATAYWVRKHSSVAPEVYRRPAVGGKANCGACHEDADTGRFDDHRIHIPKGKP
jgi:cytochrome b